MKETSRNMLWEQLGHRKYNRAFLNPSLPDIIEALKCTLNGDHVLVCFEGDIVRDDYWAHFYTMPVSLRGIFRGFIVRKRLKRWSSVAPHLLRPVKTVYNKGFARPYSVRIIDALYGNDFYSKSQTVNLKDIPHFGKNIPEHKHGWAFQETMVNAPRLMVELLKEIHALGGLVLNYAKISAENSTAVVTDMLSLQSKTVVADKNQTGSSIFQKILLYPGIPWPGFSMALRYAGETVFMSDCGNRLCLHAGCNSAESLAINSLKRELEASLGTPEPFQQDVSSVEFVNSKFPAVFRKHHFQTVLGEDATALVEDVMETSFDLARQTGIAFANFRTLFYRYGNAMEWMTNEAYNKMATTRDTNKIWNDVITEYQEKFEWFLPGNHH